MQSMLVGLLLKSVVMTLIGLLLIAATPALLKRYRAKWLYYSWLVVLVGFILPFPFHMPATVLNLSEPAPLPSKELVPANSSDITLVSSSVETLSSLSVWKLMTILWILGIILFLAVHVVRHARFMRTVKRWGQPITEPATVHLFEQVKQDMNITKVITLKESSCIRSPMLVGLLKQTLWLPPNTYSKDELNMVFKHEFVHFKRKDLWYKAFVLLISSIHWFNPLFYRFVKELDQLCEQACDDEVIKNATIQVRKTYSQTILHTEKLKRAADAFSTNFLGRTPTLKKRIVSIMDTTTKKSGIAVMVLFMLLTTGGVAISSAFAISSTPVSYVDETFMKESILNGASKGDFSTDYLMINAKKAVPTAPAHNDAHYQNTLPPDVIGTEARYRYPVEIVHKQHSQKYTTVIHIEYDYTLRAPIEYDELNRLIESYLSPFNELKSIPYADFIQPHYVETKLKAYIQQIDTQNTDERVEFTFRFTGWATNLHHLPAPSQYPISTTPRDV